MGNVGNMEWGRQGMLLIYLEESLNHMITSAHIHLLVVDTGKREVIPKSMQLVAGRTGQEYN